MTVTAILICRPDDGYSDPYISVQIDGYSDRYIFVQIDGYSDAQQRLELLRSAACTCGRPLKPVTATLLNPCFAFRDDCPSPFSRSLAAGGIAAPSSPIAVGTGMVHVMRFALRLVDASLKIMYIVVEWPRSSRKGEGGRGEAGVRCMESEKRMTNPERK